MNRYTFVVQIQPEGPSTLENLSTHERVRVSDLSAVGPQIEQWLDGLTASSEPDPTSTAKSTEGAIDA